MSALTAGDNQRLAHCYRSGLTIVMVVLWMSAAVSHGRDLLRRLPLQNLGAQLPLHPHLEGGRRALRGKLLMQLILPRSSHDRESAK